MDFIVYSLQILLVFGVPLIFGWMLLRRVFRESSWLALIPGSFLVGTVALMAAVNELRFFFEMKLAVWFAYKLLLALALTVAVALPARAPRPRLPNCANQRWQIMLIITGVILVAIYYGIPAYAGYLNDAWWHHYPSAVQIQDVERFPLNHVFALDGPLYYHHGPDILAATWSFLLELPVQKGWALYVTILAPVTFLLAFALLTRLSRSFWGGIIGASVLIAGGNLRFLLFLTGDYSGAMGSLQVFNSQTVQGLLQMVFTPSHAIGVPLVLLLLLLCRHAAARPSWLVMGAMGLLAGTLTLVAEWYFLPFVFGLSAVLLFGISHARNSKYFRTRLTLAVLPGVVALSWGAFNNTYLSGLFGHFWMRYDNVTSLANSRRITSNWSLKTHPAADLISRQKSGKILENPQYISTEPEKRQMEFSAQFGTFPLEDDSTPPPYQPKWTTPNLVPLRLNLRHFGQVPSWENAASAEDSFTPILGIKFLLEATPVLLLGIPFGLWLAWRRRQPVVVLLAFLALSSAIPPVLLDWGYRSTDFLRFFTASYSFAALFIGWLVGDMLDGPTRRGQTAGILIAVCCLAAPVGLGIIGLLPGTISKVNAIASGAKSLSQAAALESSNQISKTPPISPDLRATSSNRSAAFEKLSGLMGNFLYPITHGRERAIVIVPAEQIPEVKYFPEWMKMATLSRLQLPVGWHWQDSEYSAFYRDASSRLDARAITSLNAKWIIISNLFQEIIPPPVIEALRDRSRFAPVATFREGRYFMSAYRVLP